MSDWLWPCWCDPLGCRHEKDCTCDFLGIRILLYQCRASTALQVIILENYLEVNWWPRVMQLELKSSWLWGQLSLVCHIASRFQAWPTPLVVVPCLGLASLCLPCSSATTWCDPRRAVVFWERLKKRERDENQYSLSSQNSFTSLLPLSLRHQHCVNKGGSG